MWWWILGACVEPAPEDTSPEWELVGLDPSDAPIDGLTAEQLARFDQGDVRFEQVFRESNGLGPNYIRHSCASCHAGDGRGPGAVTKMVVMQQDGVFAAEDQSALPWGATARPQVAADAVTPLEPPEGVENLLVTQRFGPPVFGRGYVDAVDNAVIEALEAEQAELGLSGRVHWLEDGSIGRFGVKGRISTVEAFTADAFLGDMSITSPTRPDELPNPDGLTDDFVPGVDVDEEMVAVVADYVRFLAIPKRKNTEVEPLFVEVGCADCHRPTLATREDYPVAQLAGIEAPLFTDLLLHDLGADMSDGLIEGDALETEFKTAPLMGLRFFPNFLHDGRAETVEEAVLGHAGEGSEANASVSAFEALSEDGRSRLLSFVESL